MFILLHWSISTGQFGYFWTVFFNFKLWLTIISVLSCSMRSFLVSFIFQGFQALCKQKLHWLIQNITQTIPSTVRWRQLNQDKIRFNWDMHHKISDVIYIAQQKQYKCNKCLINTYGVFLDYDQNELYFRGFLYIPPL